MNAHTRSLAAFCADVGIQPSARNKNFQSDATCHQSQTLRHISELSALPRSPKEPLTPPSSDSSERQCTSDRAHHPITPVNTGFNIQEAKDQLIAEQQWQIELLTSQRAIDRQSIARLEADRERREDYDQQRDQHRIWVTQQWANGIEKIARLDRCFEESMELEHSQAEKQIFDAHAREHSLRHRIEELLAETGRLRAVVQEHADREEEAQVQATKTRVCIGRLEVENAKLEDLVSEYSRMDALYGLKLAEERRLEAARVASMNRAEAAGRTDQLELTVARLKDDARKFWGFAGSLLAVLAMLVVVKESC